MRRIRLISSNVFNPGDYTLHFVPSPGISIQERKPHMWQDIKWLLSEYLKIGWYLAYSLADREFTPRRRR
jgi:hypothetical protein